MKKIILFCISVFTAYLSMAQGGWIFDTNPQDDIVSYTTSYAYVGASFIDINGDNNIDLLASPGTLFINNGNGTFSFTTPLNFSPLNSTSGNSAADLDNDGDNDIIVAGVPCKVFFNDGTGAFADSSMQVPSFSNYGSFGAAIGDYNEDPYLDFIFAYANGFLAPSVPAPCNFYYQQTGSFNPVQVQGYPFTTTFDSYTVPYWSDYDLDGDMDLFIASGPANGTQDYDYCYKNMKMETGNDTLVQMTSELFAAQTQDGQCYNFIDYDNDGDLDLCLTNYYGAATRLYRNDNGTYAPVTTPFTTATTNLANCWGDYDNDGDLDVIITNDNQVTKYYRNDGGGTFVYLANGFTTPTATCGITNGDYDNDGDLDVFINGVGNNGNTSSVGLYINDTVAGGRSFINLKLVGVTSNRSAIGAIVKVHAVINGNPVWQMREVNAQNTFQGQNDLRVHFGLGDAAIADSIIVTWPSGNTDQFQGYAANAFYKVTEGSGVVDLLVKPAGQGQTVALYPNPCGDVLRFSMNTELVNSPFKAEIYDVSGRLLNAAIFNTATGQIDTRSLLPGVYFLRISGTNDCSVKRFVKK